MKTLTDKTVLLTGAAGGIGAFIARALVDAQATVVCVGRSPESLAVLKAEIDTQDRQVITLPFDLQNLDAMPAFVQEVEQVAGPIDVLINNAAIEKLRPFQHYALTDIQAMTVTNLLAPMLLCRLMLPGMLTRGAGHIVNISSGAGKRGAPFNSVYSATKAALINWSEGLRLELSDQPVNISVVCPGITDAGMFHALETEAPEGMKVTPPADVADVVLSAVLNNQPEVMLDGMTSKVFIALSQFSPQLGDRILQKVGIVETNRNCAHRLMQKAKS
ncbi:MAG: SDR family NAD(P)-dependent oxidoreductase [Cyanobacteria bacterium J06627_28]